MKNKYIVIGFCGNRLSYYQTIRKEVEVHGYCTNYFASWLLGDQLLDLMPWLSRSIGEIHEDHAMHAPKLLVDKLLGTLGLHFEGETARKINEAVSQGCFTTQLFLVYGVTEPQFEWLCLALRTKPTAIFYVDTDDKVTATIEQITTLCTDPITQEQ